MLPEHFCFIRVLVGIKLFPNPGVVFLAAPCSPKLLTLLLLINSKEWEVASSDTQIMRKHSSHELVILLFTEAISQYISGLCVWVPGIYIGAGQIVDDTFLISKTGEASSTSEPLRRLQLIITQLTYLLIHLVINP